MQAKHLPFTPIHCRQLLVHKHAHAKLLHDAGLEVLVGATIGCEDGVDGIACKPVHI